MKNSKHHLLTAICFAIVLLIFSTGKGISQTTIVLHPDAALGKDALLTSLDPNTNYGDHTDLLASAWTSGGIPLTSRALFQFDLSSIPSNATILGAKLSLHWNNDNSNVGHSTLSGSNACKLMRVTSTWDEYQVTWNSQPTVTSLHAVTIPKSTNDTESYNIIVTALVQDMITFGNNGFMIRLKTEQYYRSMLFASSDDGDAWRRPTLKVTYSVNEPKISSPITPQNFSVYPTLTSNEVHVICNTGHEEHYFMQLYNLAGTLEMEKELTGEASLNLQSLQSGIYLLAILDSSGRRVKMQKVIKQ